ncbi:FMN reductase [Spinactinospora alkalitolerans]|uniref:FMN reductase n=1 Tax=Spinactinospora alkalitolerans TaxID=687207 RepID=A0A852U3Q9_9ACTN|nr:FMN reductase [Spinactinospora alkalitolerans]NYE48590.1 FMN reductase [Spinactinospora alkalitolerans]
MTPRKLAVVSAGLSQPSSTRLLADRLAQAATRSLQEQGADSGTDVIELRDHAHDLANNLLTGFPSGDLRGALDGVVEADGLIAVTPIFTASYSGLFKTFFDVLEPESLAGKPVLIAATGGTARHSLALEHAVRPMFSYLRSVVVPTAVYAASEDWGSGDGGGGALTDRIDRAAAELAALVTDRASIVPKDPFDDPTPFEDLLAGPR